jgi:hypothetical protein
VTRTTAFRLPILAAAAATFVLVLFAAPAWPDGWDGLGFLASVRRFDLDAFAPHPPGYPVYVALLKAASLVTSSAMGAAILIAALSGALTVALGGAAFQSVSDANDPASALVGLSVVATPLGFHCVSVVGSEGPALALASLAAFGLARRSWVALGVGVGLGLGVRLSWAPLFLPMLFVAAREQRARAAAVALAGVLAWAIPFVVLVGPLHLGHLLSVHLAGHATRWGGTALTEPARAELLIRDIVVDGLGADVDPLGMAVGVVLLFAAGLGLMAWRKTGWAYARPVAVVFGPYLVWIAVGQNLREQPRHTLPLVALLAVGIASLGWANRSVRTVTTTLFAVMAVRTVCEAMDRHHIPPPGEAIVDYTRALVADEGVPKERILVFGGPSVRFFEETDLARCAKGAESMGDVAMALARAGPIPTRLFVTNEITEEVPEVPIKSVAAFCRPLRLDRKSPCIDLLELDPARIRVP